MWTDECFDEIQKGDVVYYMDNNVTKQGIAVKQTGMGWILNNNVVVNENNNYCGHAWQKGTT